MRRPSPRSARSRRARFVLFAVEDYPDYRPGSYFWVELPTAATTTRRACAATSRSRPPRRSAASSGSRRGSATRRSSGRSPSSRWATRCRWRSRRARSCSRRTRAARVCLRRGRDRDHRLPLDAPLHRRRVAAVRRHARLLEPRPRVAAFLDELELERRIEGLRDPDDDRRAGLGGRPATWTRTCSASSSGPRRQGVPRRRPAADGRGGRRLADRRGPAGRVWRTSSPATKC